MTVVVLVAVAIVAAVSVAALARSVGRSAPTDMDRDGQLWLASARSLIEEGYLLSEQIAGLVEEGGTKARPGVDSADPSAGLDQLTSDLAALSATAPTVMDVRVCRSVAVRSRALSEVLRSQLGCDPTIPSSGRRVVSPDLDGRRREFDVALLDLAEHVEQL